MMKLSTVSEALPRGGVGSAEAAREVCTEVGYMGVSLQDTALSTEAIDCSKLGVSFPLPPCW